MNKKRIFPYDWSRMSVAEIEDNIKYLRKNYKKHKVVHKGNSIYIDNVCICWYAKTKPDVPFKIIYSSFDIERALDINNRTFVASDGTVFQEEQQMLAEYAATLVSVMMMRAANRKAETEARKKNVVQLALEVLSYSELEAVKYIFHEINGSEGFLVASKLAEEYKLTRSVIVNALRKLESAGVIDARSLGMKGTYIKILNDYLYEELEAI